MKFLTEFGLYLLTLKGMFSKPENGKMYWKEFMHQCSEIGIGSLGIVAIISVFMGAVSTLQTAYQLVSPIIPLSTIAQIVRDTVILEFSPTLVCIVLAGVVGSKIASELGNMRVSEQIDALEIMGINTKSYLIMPKLLAAIVDNPDAGCHFGGAGIWAGRVGGDVDGYLVTATFERGCISLQALQCVFCHGEVLYVRFHHSSIPAYYGYNVSGGVAGDRTGQYEVGGGELHVGAVSRITCFRRCYCNCELSGFARRKQTLLGEARMRLAGGKEKNI